MTDSPASLFRAIAFVFLGLGLLVDLYSLSMIFIRHESGRRASPVLIVGLIFYAMFVYLHPGTFFLAGFVGQWNGALLKIGDFMILLVLHAVLQAPHFLLER